MNSSPPPSTDRDAVQSAPQIKKAVLQLSVVEEEAVNALRALLHDVRKLHAKHIDVLKYTPRPHPDDHVLEPQGRGEAEI